VLVLKRCFDGFADEEGAIPADNVGSILSMMGMKVKPSALRYYKFKFLTLEVSVQIM
jgi:hypothetical protein